MHLSRTCHLTLLYPLLLLTALRAYTQQPPDSPTQQRNYDTIRVYFAFNSYAIDFQKDTAKGRTYFRWPAFTRKKIDTVFITGYTDTVGTNAYNQHLSSRRAAAAANWLNSQLAHTTLHPAPASLPVLLVTGGGKAPTPQYSDSINRRAELIISYTTHPSDPVAAVPAPATATTTAPAAPPPAAAATPPPPIVITLHHINFEIDTPIPTAATREAMPSNVQVLLPFKDRHLEIDGYVNSISPLHGEKDPLFILSVKRAKYIYDYLIEAGFDPAKLSYKGMGNATPVNPDPTTTEEMSANMRVEIKVF